MRGGRRRFNSGTPWEPVVGYSRAVRVGNTIYVSGTTAMGSAGEIVGGADAAAQMRKALENVRVAVDRLGGSMEDVVRTRVYLKDIQHWESVGRVHREAFGTTPPASTMVEVHGFVSPDILVEIEAEAIVEDPRRRVRRHLARRRIPFRRSGHRP